MPDAPPHALCTPAGPAGAALLASFFAYACYCQVVAPWEVKYTGELRTVVTSEQVICAFVLQGLAAAAVAYGLLVDLPKQGECEARGPRDGWGWSWSWSWSA